MRRTCAASTTLLCSASESKSQRGENANGLAFEIPTTASEHPAHRGGVAVSGTRHAEAVSIFPPSFRPDGRRARPLHSPPPDNGGDLNFLCARACHSADLHSSS